MDATPEVGTDGSWTLCLGFPNLFFREMFMSDQRCSSCCALSDGKHIIHSSNVSEITQKPKGTPRQFYRVVKLSRKAQETVIIRLLPLLNTRYGFFVSAEQPSPNLVLPRRLMTMET